MGSDAGTRRPHGRAVIAALFVALTVHLLGPALLGGHAIGGDHAASSHHTSLATAASDQPNSPMAVGVAPAEHEHSTCHEVPSLPAGSLAAGTGCPSDTSAASAASPAVTSSEAPSQPVADAPAPHRSPGLLRT